jgi:two-component system LytT family sensor kinase
MHTTRTKLVFGLAWILFWGMLTWVAVQDYRHDEDAQEYWKPILWETSSMVAATLLLVIQRHFTRRHDKLVAQPWRWLSIQARWLPMYWIAFTPIAFGIRHAVYAMAGDTYQHEPWLEVFVYEAIKLSVFVGMFILIAFGILSYSELLQEKLRAEKSNALLRQAQLQRLAQQMQPHFLFNALNTISSLMHTDVHKADATLIQLADVLRTTLDVSELHEAPLSTELKLVRGYADVMQARYADRVEIDWRIDQGTLACIVPVMSIQPLLENVFKHTVERRRQLTRIRIETRIDDGRLLVLIEDDTGTLAGTTPPGIGLRNLRERLDVLYSGRATLALSQLSPAGVRAEMEVPCVS